MSTCILLSEAPTETSSNDRDGLDGESCSTLELGRCENKEKLIDFVSYKFIQIHVLNEVNAAINQHDLVYHPRVGWIFRRIHVTRTLQRA